MADTDGSALSPPAHSLCVSLYGVVGEVEGAVAAQEEPGPAGDDQGQQPRPGGHHRQQQHQQGEPGHRPHVARPLAARSTTVTVIVKDGAPQITDPVASGRTAGETGAK